MKLLLIDGNSIMNRAFYGIRLLSNKKGTFTNALTGFMNIYMKLLKEEQPDRGAALRREAQIKKLTRAEKLALIS